MLRTLLVLLLCLVALPSRAQVLTLGSWGSWTAFGGAQQDGQRVCGVAVRGDGRSVHFRIFAGQADATVELFRRGWEIAQPYPVAFTLQPGRYTTPVLRGNGLPREGRLPARVAAAMPYEPSRPFWSALRGAALLRVAFMTGTERPWVVATTGSAAAMQALTDCARRMGASTGPLEDPAMTRPFDAPARRP